MFTFNFIDPDVLFIVLGIITAIIGSVIVYVGFTRWKTRGDKISGRLEHYVAEDKSTNKDTPKRIIPREITGSFFSRILDLWTQNSARFLSRFTPEGHLAKVEHDLGIAGYPMNLHAREFSALRLLILIMGIFLALLVNRDFLHLQLTEVLFGILIILFSFILPTVWLRGLVRSNKDEIRRDLPDALDMMSVCASAGLGFDQSLQKISNYWHTNLGTELKRVTHEMEMGVSRATALKNLNERLDVDDLTRFIAIIVQAEGMGMSYAEVLHSQAAQMRVLRQYRAREIANKLPAKMIVPLAILIFPALIAVIIGPIVPTLLDLF